MFPWLLVNVSGHEAPSEEKSGGDDHTNYIYESLILLLVTLKDPHRLEGHGSNVTKLSRVFQESIEKEFEVCREDREHG